MANDALVSAVKEIVALGRAGKLDEAYRRYQEMFTLPTFLTARPEDQRQVLKLMILSKNVPNPPTEAMLEAHRAALVPLTEMVSTLAEPADHELLGACHVVLGNIEAASSIFKAALAIERQRDPGSTLCGQLMKRVSDI
jgi:hypothetical protein